MGIAYHVPQAGIDCLDRFEGYPTHYGRKNVHCKIHGDPTSGISCVAYIATSGASDFVTGLKPTREYLSHLCARKGQLPDYYQSKLESFQCVDAEKEIWYFAYSTDLDFKKFQEKLEKSQIFV